MLRLGILDDGKHIDYGQQIWTCRSATTSPYSKQQDKCLNHAQGNGCVERQD